MCAISGVFNKNGKPVTKKEIDSMLNTMLHRGPDDRGFYIAPSTQDKTPNIGLGHLRLSIIDLTSDGHQPMSSTDGNLTIVHNGEIYNYIEIREELKKLGGQWSGPMSADTLFTKRNREKFDGILTLYHDQGLIPFKMYSDLKGVNFTAGLPLVRTSPDHGVAMDVAGKWLEDHC